MDDRLDVVDLQSLSVPALRELLGLRAVDRESLSFLWLFLQGEHWRISGRGWSVGHIVTSHQSEE